MLYIAVEAVD